MANDNAVVVAIFNDLLSKYMAAQNLCDRQRQEITRIRDANEDLRQKNQELEKGVKK